jgi:hypothetical protein
MSAAPARRTDPQPPRRRPRPSGPAPARDASRNRQSPRAVSAQRRRRQRHFARRRRDLIQDASAALVIAVFLISVTAGLGVLALLEIPLVGALIASLIAERVIARRRAAPPSRRAGRSSRRTAPSSRPAAPSPRRPQRSRR